MVLKQLEDLLTEQGFTKVPSNLPEFSFFFHSERTYVNVLHIVDYKQGLYITEDQYVHIKGKIRDFFVEKGMQEVHILSLLVSTDTQKARQLCGNDPFCWLIDSAENRLLVHENQMEDFYGMRKLLEDFLYEISLSEAGASPTGEGVYSGGFRESRADEGKAVWNTVKSYRVNIALVALNVILFTVCTFTGDLLYNIGAFSVLDLVESGGWHRIITSMFLHADVEHLVSNMLILYYIGNVVEKNVGHLPYALLYFLSGIMGNVFSAGYELWTGYYISSVGASGAVFGVEGALLLLAFVQKGKLAGMTTGRIVFSIAFSLYCGFTSSYVNNAAHVGGVLTGFVAASIYWLFLSGAKKKTS